MEPSHSTSSDLDVVESLSDIEFDAESGSYRATYDSTRDSASFAVIAVVATALDRDPLNLTPLQSVIETDSLEELATGSSIDDGNRRSISFPYEGFEITIFSDGVIRADSAENS